MTTPIANGESGSSVRTKLNAIIAKVDGIEDNATADQDLSGYLTTAATLDDIADGTTNKAFTDAEKTLLGNQSGTNTGDQVIPFHATIACSDETTDLATGTSVATFRAPVGFTLTEVRASVSAAPVGTTIAIDVNEGGVSLLSTVVTIDAGEKTSTTAATPAVIADSAIADDAELTIDIDQVGSTTAGAGLKVTLIGTL
jgi:hypothetical protein